VGLFGFQQLGQFFTFDYFHWNDRQCLEQAIWVAQAQPIKLKEIQKFATNEGMEKKYEDFLEILKKGKKE
jgi:hypothetical protein